MVEREQVDKLIESLPSISEEQLLSDRVLQRDLFNSLSFIRWGIAYHEHHLYPFPQIRHTLGNSFAVPDLPFLIDNPDFVYCFKSSPINTDPKQYLSEQDLQVHANEGLILPHEFQLTITSNEQLDAAISKLEEEKTILRNAKYTVFSYKLYRFPRTGGDLEFWNSREETWEHPCFPQTKTYDDGPFLPYEEMSVDTSD